MERGGGLLTHEDLDGYQVVWRDPVRSSYRGHTLLSMPPPSSGGVALALTCAMLEPFGLGAMPWHGVEHVHLLAEVWRRTYADRNHYLADPAYHDMPLETLVSPGYAAWRAATLSADAATPSRDVGPGMEGWLSASGAGGTAPPRARAPQAREGEHTTHLSVVDGEGNAVSLTTTVNSWYGSKVVAAGTGVLLNNDMDDFTSKPGAPNQFGLVQGEANRIEPGKRMLSAMSPTVVLGPDGRLGMVVGSPGGSTIITTVFQVIANTVDHGMDVAQAVLAPRIHHQHLPDQIWYEPAGLPAEVVEGLEALGHRTVEREEPSGDVQAIQVLPDGTLQGQSDPRRGGVALGL
jgi:gamma-glutamyltranspeptidase/glutathione hydrolase